MLSTTHSSTSSSGNNTHRGDKLLLNGLVFHGYHGVYQHERETGQRFVVDLELSTNLIKAGKIVCSFPEAIVVLFQLIAIV